MSNDKPNASLNLDAPESSLDLEQIWHVLREKSWLIALCGLIGIFGGLAYIQRTPLTYAAQAVIEVDPEPAKIVNFDAGQQEKDPVGEEMGQTLLAVFRSRAFAEQVIERYKLQDDPEFLPPLPNGKRHAIEDAVGPLIGMSKAVIRPGTRFIDVSTQHRNPQVAKKLPTCSLTPLFKIPLTSGRRLPRWR